MYILTKYIEKAKFHGVITLEFLRKSAQIYVQPLFCVSSNRVHGGEVLIRLNTVDNGYEALNILKSRYNDAEIDKFILSETTKFICKNRNIELDILPLHVNISANTLENSDSIDEIIDIIENAECKDDIILEINENTNFDSSDVSFNIEKLLSRNIMISLDDFNVASSGISSLSKFRVQEIKLRQTGLGEFNNRDIIILKNINALCKELGTNLVIEGIETQTQLDVVKSLGIDTIQGYIYSVPLPISTYIKD